MYVKASAGPSVADTPNNETCSTATCFIPQGRASPAAASSRRKHRQHRPPRLVWAALLRLTHAHPLGASSAYRHQHPRQGCYLKLAGEFTRTLRPDGGLGFLFSLSAMTPRYFSAISSGENELPPRKHLSEPSIRWCLQRLAEKENSPPPERKRGILTLYFPKNYTKDFSYIVTLRIHSERLIIRWAHLQLLNIHERKKWVLQICLESIIIPTEI